MKIVSQAEYDAVKAKLHNMPLHTNELLLASMEIEKQLLEYRRQNGFFEDGDYIIDTLIGNEVIKYHDGYKLMPDNYVSSFLMHASDAEIEANRRLDLPESVKSLGEVS